MSTRRHFLKASIALATMGTSPGLVAATAVVSGRYRLGLFISLGQDPDSAVATVAEAGLSCCEAYTNEISVSFGQRLREALDRHHIECVSLFASGPGPQVYNFLDGPSTIGLVPREWRQARLDALKRGSDLCQRIRIPAFETHVGFVPEDPRSALYAETVEACKQLAAHCKDNGLLLFYHAGMESPTTALRLLQDVGLDNQRIGLDTANLILYGKGHPTQALETYGKLVGQVNAKDGLYPTGTKELGKDVPLGEGKVDFPHFFKTLQGTGYRGPIIIECEVSGQKFPAQVKQAKGYLENLQEQGR